MPYVVKELIYSGGYGKNASDRLQDEYPNHIILIFDGARFRAYAESAKKICDIVSCKSYKASNGFVVVIPENELRYYQLFLTFSCTSYIIIKTNSKSVHTYVTDNTATADSNIIVTPHSLQLPKIEDSSRVILEAEHEITKVILLENGLSIQREITLVDGTIKILSVPITETDGYTIVKSESPIYQALKGKHKNEVITCNGIEYLIADVLQ